ncbi:hypothetical protein [Jannaschia helgolandensis]|uniref:Uncharacterized protein n=1 Tax=Jannaschia helgolandensis TaxID=188906 RepID=A0A1H7P2L3_9RHOB|nr:hypothetical protein [Jannaschia helgolandensis]SEL30052.1 hypothetical protein SAMN04488526_2396 [Jannaschia helgolandensis]
MAKDHAHRLYAEGIDLDSIRRWLMPLTTRKECDEILSALPHRVACAA